MKEMEKIALLKILRKQREEADKLTESITDSETKKIFRNASIKTDNPKDKVGLLDTIISQNYKCGHEYGIRNIEDEFCGCSSICLDCGEYLTTSDIKGIYTVREKLNNIRNEYLELIQQMSICDSFVTLKRKYNFKKYK